MVKHRWMITSLVVFFCLTGWVCSNPALGEAPAESEKEAVPSIYDESADTAVETDVDEIQSDVEAEDVTGEQTEPPQEPGFSFNQKIDLHVKQLELSKVLQLLSIQSRRNIIASRNVSGTISANLHGVDFYEALEAVLHANGFAYREKGNFIYVYTAEEIAKLEETNRKTKTEIVKLNYLTSKDAATYVQPLLSPAGSIVSSREAPAGFQPSISDAGANTHAQDALLVVNDYPENIAEIKNVIQQLDVRPKQVEIEVYILRVSLDDTYRWGVDFSVVTELNISAFTNPLSPVSELISGAVQGNTTALQSQVGDTGADGGFKVGVTDKDFSVFIDALSKVTDTTVLARPKLLVLNRQRADLLIGGRRGYITSTTTDTATSTTVEFLEIGTQLTVRPFISNDGYVRMELKPSISDGQIEQFGQDIVVPREETQELTTNVLVRSGQTVIMGGLFKEETTVTRRQVPLLGDIPIAGAAFKGQNDTVKRDEYIFMVRPTVVKDEQLIADGERGLHGIELARIGARDGLLPWAREKMVAYHLKQAMEEYQHGDARKALLYTRWALRIDPTLAQARQLKQKISGEKKYFPERSVLDDVVDNLVREEVGPLKNVEAPVSDSQPTASTQPEPSELVQPQEADAGQQEEDDLASFEEAEEEVGDEVDLWPEPEPRLDVDFDDEVGQDDDGAPVSQTPLPDPQELVIQNPLGSGQDEAELAAQEAEQNPLNLWSDETGSEMELAAEEASTLESLFNRLNEWLPEDDGSATATALPDDEEE